MKQKSLSLAIHWRMTPLARVLGPMQEFIQQAQTSGIILLLMTVFALIIANSPLYAGYVALLETHVGITAGSLVLDESVLHWVNDGLMALFFFVVGLPITHITGHHRVRRKRYPIDNFTPVVEM